MSRIGFPAIRIHLEKALPKTLQDKVVDTIVSFGGELVEGIARTTDCELEFLSVPLVHPKNIAREGQRVTAQIRSEVRPVLSSIAQSEDRRLEDLRELVVSDYAPKKRQVCGL